MNVTMDPSISILVSTLDRQNEALLSGDLSTLEKFEAELASALRLLDPDRIDPQELRLLQDKAKHCAGLVRAAQKGVARARDQILGSQTQELSTYDAAGNKVCEGTSSAKTLKRS